MDKTKILALIAALYLLEIKERPAHIKEAARENGIGEGDLFKALDEAGYNSKTEKGTKSPDAPGADSKPLENDPPKPEGKKQSVTLRHKTEYPKYRRAGLVLTQKAETYEVTEAQLAALKKDPWVVAGNGDGAKK